MAQRVFDITTKFITALDMIEMDARAVDDLLPAITQIVQALQNYPNLPADYKGLQTTTTWQTKLSALKAFDQISEEEARQLKFELQGAMQHFNDVVLRGH